MQYPAEEPKKTYDYYAKPDGDEILDKLWFLIKPAATIAIAASSVDVLIYSKPRSYPKIFGRYLYISAPILGVTTAFVLTSNIAGNIRGKSDKLNWFLGGAAAGSIIGVWRKSVPGGFVAAGALGLAAFVKKYCVDKGYDWFPDHVQQHYGGIWSTRQDWTLTKYRPGNWTTGKE